MHLPPAFEGGGGEDRPWLAWIDEAEGGYLVLANSEAGLVTGRALEAKYGQQDVYFSADPRQLPIPVELPVARVEGKGNLDALVIDVEMLPGQDPLAGQPITVGTMGGLLEGPNITAGVTSTYSDYDVVVKDITSQVNAQVRQLPFLIRSIGEDLAASLNTTLRTWDGRSLVAMGPANHLRVAYGANDVAKSRVATIRLLQKVIDNASIARNFTNAVPKMYLKRRVAKADGMDIELFVLGRAASFVPPEARSLIDSEGRLNVAMAWSERAGGGVMVIGPEAASELAAWLEGHVEITESRGDTKAADLGRVRGRPGFASGAVGYGATGSAARHCTIVERRRQWAALASRRHAGGTRSLRDQPRDAGRAKACASQVSSRRAARRFDEFGRLW